MKTATESNTSTQLWGIYYRDREFTRVKDDRLRTIISAQSKEEAEHEALRLGFEDPWAHPVTNEEAIRAHWSPVKRLQNQGTKPERRSNRVRV